MHNIYYGYTISFILPLQGPAKPRGYCTPTIPKITARKLITGQSSQKYALFFWTYSFDSLIWLFDAFYIDGVKRIPRGSFLYTYLDPLALAIWAQDDGSKTGSGLKLCTNSFPKEDVDYLITILKDLYNLKCSAMSSGEQKDQYVIYIWTESMEDFRTIVTPYFHSSMLYKLS